MQGWRNHHEDAHEMHCQGSAGGFWVLDGHGGDGAAHYGAPELAKEIGNAMKEMELPADKEIERGFAAVDSRLRGYVAEHPEKDSGSTVTGALIARQTDGTYTAKLCNCGDSRGLLVRGPGEIALDDYQVSIPQHLEALMSRPDAVLGDTVPDFRWPVVAESIDHKPSHPTEKRRIETAGGHVTEDDPPRLDGNLAVSRGLGDFEYKQDSGRPVPEQKVSVVPDIYSVSGLKAGTLCILACDGIWDVMTGEAVAEFIRGSLQRDPNADLGDLCAELIRLSLRRNSRDNMTVMIVHLLDGSDWSLMPDEMKNYDKISEQAHDEDARKNNVAFLRKSQFPLEPKPCAVCKKWIAEMHICPCKAEFYCNRDCQKKGWKAHKPLCSASGNSGSSPPSR